MASITKTGKVRRIQQFCSSCGDFIGDERNKKYALCKACYKIFWLKQSMERALRELPVLEAEQLKRINARNVKI